MLIHTKKYPAADNTLKETIHQPNINSFMIFHLPKVQLNSTKNSIHLVMFKAKYLAS